MSGLFHSLSAHRYCTNETPHGATSAPMSTCDSSPASTSPPNSSRHLPQPPSETSKIRLAPPRPKRIIVAITGATGAVLAIRLLQILKEVGIETHVILSKWAVATLKYETDMTASEIRELAETSYNINDMAAGPSSGSFLHDGMIVVPCSMKTLAAIRIGYCDDLITRAADVTLKEGRKLMLVVRETPLSDIHLENMLFLRRAGATIFPPVPAFYIRPESVEDLIDQSVGRMLDSMGIHIEGGFERWQGTLRR